MSARASEAGSAEAGKPLRTGTEMVVRAGCAGTNRLMTGGRCEAIGDRWLEVTTRNGAVARCGFSGTGTIVYGGCGGSGAFGDPYSFAPRQVVYLHLKQ